MGVGEAVQNIACRGEGRVSQEALLCLEQSGHERRVASSSRMCKVLQLQRGSFPLVDEVTRELLVIIVIFVRNQKMS